MEGPPSDATLLVGVAERDIGAFRTLYERHAGWLSLRLARRCNDAELVADAVQDTFVVIWQKPRSFRGDGDVAAWLWGIAIRRLVSRLRTRGGVAAELNEGSSGEYDASASSRRKAAAKNTTATSSLSRRFFVGLKTQRMYFI